jgi:hypothetical protein
MNSWIKPFVAMLRIQFNNNRIAIHEPCVVTGCCVAAHAGWKAVFPNSAPNTLIAA